MVPFAMVSPVWGSHVASKQNLSETQLAVPVGTFIFFFSFF